jgi:hypothetical protein
MGVSTTAGSAERLQRAAGTWRLEFEQLVYNAPAILRPRRFAVLGEHAILLQLREFGGHEPLAKDAERLFARGAVPDGTYIARSGRWLPEVRPDAVVPEPEEPENPPKAQLDDGVVAELNTRIASLETTVRALQKMLDGAMRALADQASRPAASDRAGPAWDRRDSMSPGAPIPQPMAAAPDPISAAAAALMSPPVPVPRLAITSPTATALSDLCKSLAGPDASLISSDRVDWSKLAAEKPVFAAPINDHDGNDVGAMVMDIESALRLAGALLMESEETVTTLLDEKMMSDEMLDAASEVCNTLMSSFNKIAGNPHLRAGKLVLMADHDAGWIAHARKVDDYRYSHGGRVAMVVR